MASIPRSPCLVARVPACKDTGAVSMIIGYRGYTSRKTRTILSASALLRARSGNRRVTAPRPSRHAITEHGDVRYGDAARRRSVPGSPT
jgi:hypothetical protein